MTVTRQLNLPLMMLTTMSRDLQHSVKWSAMRKRWQISIKRSGLTR